MTDNRHRLRILTANADFTDGPGGSYANVAAVLPGAAVTMVQEGKRLTWSSRFTRLLGTYQDTTSPATMGSVVIWDRSQILALAGRSDLLVEPRRGDRMLGRYAAVVDVEQRATGRRGTFISAHRPPPLYDHLWEEFDYRLGEIVDAARYPVVVGIDSNTRRPAQFAHGLGLTWHGRGIDGFLADPDLQLDGVRRMRRTASDHRAITGLLTL